MAQELNPFDQFDENPFDQFDASPAKANTDFVGPLTPEQESDKAILGRASIMKSAGEQVPKLLKGLGEMALTTVTGAITTPLAGIAGVGTLMGNGTLDQAAANVKKVQDWTYQPKSEGGKLIGDVASEAMGWYVDAADRVAEKVTGGDPFWATVIKTAIVGAPEIAGGTKMFMEKSARNVAIEQIQKKADEINVDLGSSRMREQLRDFAGKQVSGVKGSAMEEAMKVIRDQAEITSKFEDNLFTKARGFDARVRGTTVKDFYLDTTQTLMQAGFDLPMMPNVKARLSEFAEISEAVDASQGNVQVKLNYLETLKQRMGLKQPNPNKPANPGAPISHPRETAAFEIMRTKFEEMLQSQFDQDMIIGDQMAVDAWKKAREYRGLRIDTFEANPVIARLIANKEVTPKEFTNWALGASAVNGKNGVVAVIKRMKSIVGEDSPAMTGVRQEFLNDVLEPMLDKQPDLGEFIRRYDKSIAKNGDVVEALAPYNVPGIKSLYEFSKAIKATGGDFNVALNGNRILAQALFGHQIAKAAMRRSIAESAIQYLRGTGGGERRAIIREMLGYDPNKAIIPKKSLAFGAFAAEQANDVFSTDNPNKPTVDLNVNE